MSVTVLKNSGASICQKCFRNSAGKPSGPGALPFGILLKASCSSIIDKGASKVSIYSLDN